MLYPYADRLLIWLARTLSNTLALPLDSEVHIPNWLE